MKSLVAITVGCAVALSVLACYRQRVERQRRAVAAICEAGGVVIYDRDWAPVNHPPRPPRFPRATEWLGRDWFDSVDGVEIAGEAAKIVPHLRDLGHLRYLFVYDSTFGDTELALVAELHDIEDFDMRDSSTTDDGMARLASLPNLKSLMLEGENISADCLFSLAGHTQLEELHVVFPDIRGRHLAVLRSLPSLRKLVLSADDAVHDEDLAFLEGCAQLRILRMENNSLITDAGLLHLAKLSRLEELAISMEAPISRQGYEKFHEAVPDCVLWCLWYHKEKWDRKDRWDSKERPEPAESKCDPESGEAK